MTESRTQRLIAIADQVAAEPDRPSKRPWWPFAVGAAVLALVVGGIGFAIAGGDDSADATGGAAATATSADEGSSDSGDASATATTIDGTSSTDDISSTDGTVAAAGTDGSDDESTDTTAAPVKNTTPTTTPATTVAPAATATTVAPATTVAAAPETTVAASAQPATETVGEQPVRWAEFSGGKVYLEGTVPDQATADEVRDKAGAVVGPDNVIVNYDIVAGAPRPPSAPLYVRDSVLFAKNSVDINDTARGVLDLGVVLMSQNPQVTIDINGHTDSDGSDEMNLTLSQRRVQVIFDYLVSQGVDPSRLTTAAYGETQPIADNGTAAGRAKNRRVEFQINNLLG